MRSFLRGLGSISAKAGFGADSGVIAAGVGATLVNRAQAGLRIQIQAVAIGAARQREDAVLEIEMLDDARLLQALGDLLGVFAQLEFIDHADSYQIGQFHFNRHGAAGGVAGFAQSGAIFEPTAKSFKVRVVQERFFHSSPIGKGLSILPDGAVVVKLQA